MSERKCSTCSKTEKEVKSWVQCPKSINVCMSCCSECEHLDFRTSIIRCRYRIDIKTKEKRA